MKNDVYLLAAEECDKDVKLPSCWGISRNPLDHDCSKYSDLFDFDRHVSEIWGDQNEYTRDTQKCRVLALLFMHAIVSSERKSRK